MAEKGLVRIIDDRRIRQVVSEITGRPVGVQIEHRDGRMSAAVRAQTVEVSPDVVAPSQSELRKRVYASLRQKGHSHEGAMILMGVRHV